MNTKITQILELAVANNASDIHLSASSSPRIRVNGVLNELPSVDMGSPQVATDTILSTLSQQQLERFKAEKELDYSLSVGGHRLRVNMFLKNGEVSCAMRIVPLAIPDFGTMNLPRVLSDLAEYKQGLILVAGPTGHGKSTTVAATLNKINQERSCHILTIEDPIEYVITPVKSIISQRELGSDTDSFTMALKSALRQDPNVVFVGEMRDLETVALALTVAETGHLVFSTLHTNSASQTIDRIIDVFPEGSKDQIRVQLASVLTAVISQRLVPAVNGGRVPAFEILVATSAVKNAIREGKSFMIDNVIQTSSDLGMVSLEQSLANLVKQGVVAEDVAMSYALRPVELQNSLRSKRMI
jgi:twitching motility protein PilT